MFDPFFKTVLELSENKEYFCDAVKEWDITNYVELEKDETDHCECGHIIQKVYSLTNRKNHNILPSIGNECINKFDYDVFTEEKKILKQKNKIFKNKNKSCDGLTYEYICNNRTEYINFIKENGKKKNYIDLCKYYELFLKLQQRQNNLNSVSIK